VEDLGAQGVGNDDRIRPDREVRADADAQIGVRVDRVGSPVRRVLQLALVREVGAIRDAVPLEVRIGPYGVTASERLPALEVPAQVARPDRHLRRVAESDRPVFGGGRIPELEQDIQGTGPLDRL
jgi:hypothetical protein